MKTKEGIGNKVDSIREGTEILDNTGYCVTMTVGSLVVGVVMGIIIQHYVC